MPLSDVRKYLTAPQVENDSRDGLFERANGTASALRILNDELGCSIPELDSGSRKFLCPWTFEHSDPYDKNCRFYAEDNHAYCFALHGRLDPVGIRSLQWHMSRTRVAEIMLERAGLTGPSPWWERIAELQNEAAQAQPKPADLTQAQAALYTALRGVDGYARAQYSPQVQQAVSDALGKFRSSWDMDAVLAWVETTRARVEGLC